MPKIPKDIIELAAGCITLQVPAEAVDRRREELRFPDKKRSQDEALQMPDLQMPGAHVARSSKWAASTQTSVSSARWFQKVWCGMLWYVVVSGP